MKKRLVSLLLIAFLVLTDIAPVITVAAEELGTPDPTPIQHEFTTSAEDDGISLTREMMRVFAEGREPR